MRLLLEHEAVVLDPSRPRRPLTGSERLIAAVLRQAFLDLEDASPRVRALAEEWFLDLDSDGPYALTGVCEALGLNRVRVLAATGDPVRRAEVIERFRREWDQGGRGA